LLRELAQIKSAFSRFRGEFYEAGIGAEVGVPFPIRLDALRPTDRLGNDEKLFEAVARSEQSTENETDAILDHMAAYMGAPV